MTQAAFELQRTGAKVIDIALKYGYSSPTSFNRAFQSVHNITPAAARSIGNTFNAYPAIRFSVQVTGGNAMTYHIIQKQSMRMVGVRIPCLLYTSDAADDLLCVDLGGRCIIKKKKKKHLRH